MKSTFGRGNSEDAASVAAGQELGLLAKSVIVEDKRTFEAEQGGYVSSYRWIGGEP